MNDGNYCYIKSISFTGDMEVDLKNLCSLYFQKTSNVEFN